MPNVVDPRSYSSPARSLGVAHHGLAAADRLRPHHAHRRLARRVRRRLDAFDERRAARLGGGGGGRAGERAERRSVRTTRAPRRRRGALAAPTLAADRTGRSTRCRPPPPPRPRRRRRRRAAAGANRARSGGGGVEAAAAAKGVPPPEGTPASHASVSVASIGSRNAAASSSPASARTAASCDEPKRMVAARGQVVKVSHVLYQRHQRHAELLDAGRQHGLSGGARRGRRMGRCVCPGAPHRNMAMPLRTSTSDNRCGVVTTTAAVSPKLWQSVSWTSPVPAARSTNK